MKVSLVSSGKVKELELKNKRIELFSLRGMFELIVENDETAWITVNSSEETECLEGIHQVCSIFNNDNKCVITIRYISKGKLSSIQYTLVRKFGVPIEKRKIENLMHFSQSTKNAVGQKGSIEDLFHALESGQITLLNVKKPLTGYDNLSLISDLQDVISQKIRAICSSPKQGTRVEELVQDVSMVKRINTNTLTHLAAHTEHWKARTLSGLIPKRLRADVIADEINIYENLFFKLAIDDISDYVSDEINSIQNSINNNTVAIDWEQYGKVIQDYRRGKLVSKLTRGKDVEALGKENEYFQFVKEEWTKISRMLLTIKSSAFYQSIDRKKHISRNIHLTNILRNDQRYKALYDTWCLVHREKQRDKEEIGLAGDIRQNPLLYYCNYSCVALLYSMRLLGIAFEEESVIEFSDDKINVIAKGYDVLCNYQIKTTWNEYDELTIELKIQENLEIPVALPEFDTSGFPWEEVAQIVTVSGNQALFHKQPISSERNDIYDLCQQKQSVVRKMSFEKQAEYKNTVHKWKEWVDKTLALPMLRNPGESSICIKPCFIECESKKEKIEEFTDALFSERLDKAVYLMPTEWMKYREVKERDILRRLFNYGEAFGENDLDSLKKYRVGALPVTQTDIGSIQRLMKLISLQKSVLMIEWQGNTPIKCPICGCSNIISIGSNSWKCMEPSCGIEWGKTKCMTKCKELFSWIQPDAKTIKKIRMQDIGNNSICEEIQTFDNIFDRYVITDFEIEDENGKLKLYPVCPNCGGRRKN